MLKVTARTQQIGIALYALPFLAILAFSLFVMSVGVGEIVVIGVALLPAVLYFLGVRWCRYVVGVIAAMGFLACSWKAIQALTVDQGRYFWVIWSPIWLVFAFSSFISFIPVRERLLRN
jgi:hypothetical protein